MLFSNFWYKISNLALIVYIEYNNVGRSFMPVLIFE